MQGELAECAHRVKDLLSRGGFSVVENPVVKGLSGFEHRFSLAALKGGRTVLISIVKANPLALLGEIAKSVDVLDEVIILVHGALPPGFRQPAGGGRVKLVEFASIRELEEKVSKLLLSKKPAGGAAENPVEVPLA